MPQVTEAEVEFFLNALGIFLSIGYTEEQDIAHRRLRNKSKDKRYKLIKKSDKHAKGIEKDSSSDDENANQDVSIGQIDIKRRKNMLDESTLNQSN